MAAHNLRILENNPGAAARNADARNWQAHRYRHLRIVAAPRPKDRVRQGFGSLGREPQSAVVHLGQAVTQEPLEGAFQLLRG